MGTVIFFYSDRLVHAGFVTAGVVTARVIAESVATTDFGVLKGGLSISLHIVLLSTAYSNTKTSMDYSGNKSQIHTLNLFFVSYTRMLHA